MSALEKFNAVMKRLNAILGEYGEIAKARQIPGEFSSNVLRHDVICRGGYERSQPAADAVMECVKEAAAKERRRGENMRDVKLLALAEEIGSLRAVLPAMAAAAAVELGQTVRDLREEVG